MFEITCSSRNCQQMFPISDCKKFCSDTCRIENQRNSKALDRSEQNMKVLQSSVSNEWYTPKEYVDAVHELMGNIDLDPASNSLANENVRALKFFSVSDDGLSKNWKGKIFLNPPYGISQGKSNQMRWSHRLIQQYQIGNCSEAVLLVNASTGNKWFAPLWQFPLCFVSKRIRYISPSHHKISPTHSNVFVYMGKQSEKFEAIFSRFGQVVYARSPSKVPVEK